MSVSELILQTKMYNVRTHVIHENIIPRVRTYVTYKMCYIRIYVIHENEMYSVELMLQTTIRCIMSKFILHMKVCNVRTNATHKNMTSRVRTYVTTKMCNVGTYVTHKYDIIFIRINLTYKNV